MQQYELLYIVPGQYTDEEVQGIMKRVSSLLAKHGCTISREENLGKIKLAYPIKKTRHGSYVLVHFAADGLAALERELRMDEQILRHQIIILPKGAALKKYELTSYVPPLSDEARRDSVPAPQTRPAVALPPPPPAVKPEVPALSVEELDKKLDEILEDDLSAKA
jgi:small subunit ribosomal protein S6